MDQSLAENQANNIGEPVVPQPEYVWFWRRAAARLIDMVYFYIVSFVVGIFCVFVLIVLDQNGGTNYLRTIQEGSSITAVGFLVGALATLLYHTILEGIHGSTLGKLIVGITVLDNDLRPCGLFSALLRSIAFIIDSLIFGGVAAMSMQNSDTNQRLGDRWAKTVVVRRKSVPKELLRSPIAFLASFLISSGALAASVVVTLVLKIQ